MNKNHNIMTGTKSKRINRSDKKSKMRKRERGEQISFTKKALAHLQAELRELNSWNLRPEEAPIFQTPFGTVGRIRTEIMKQIEFHRNNL